MVRGAPPGDAVAVGAPRQQGLGRPLREILPGGDAPHRDVPALFLVDDDSTAEDVLDHAAHLLAAAQPDAVCGYWMRGLDGTAVTRIVGATDADRAWALAGVLERAVQLQRPWSGMDARCFAASAGRSAALGIVASKPLDARACWLVHSLATSCGSTASMTD